MPRRPSRPQRLIVVLLLTLWLAACRTEVDPTADEAAIRALVQQTQEMNNAGDIDGWVALFESGAVYMPPGQPAVTTVDGLREAARAGFTNWRSDIRIVPEEVVTSGDWAFARSTVTGTATPVAGGAPVAVNVKQIVLYHREPDGGWRIARLITNSNGS